MDFLLSFSDIRRQVVKLVELAGSTSIRKTYCILSFPQHLPYPVVFLLLHEKHVFEVTHLSGTAYISRLLYVCFLTSGFSFNRHQVVKVTKLVHISHQVNRYSV